MPWAFLLALLLMGAVEVGLRGALPVEEFPTRHDLRIRGCLRHVLDHYGAAEIAFVGASVCRRSTNIPRIREACAVELGREVTVANYSHVGLWAELGEDVIHVLLREDPAPRLIVYGVTLHQIRSIERDDIQTSWVWTFPDWQREFEEHGFATFDEFPQVLRNEIRRYWRTFQARYAKYGIYHRIAHGVPFDPSSMMGDVHHIERASKLSIARRLPAGFDENVRNLRDKIDRCTHDGVFRFSEERIQNLRNIQRMCDEAGVRILFYEVPLPEVHRNLFPAGAEEAFHTHMRQLSEECGLHFVPFADLGLTVTDKDFADQSHLNLPGANRITEALLEHALLDLVQEYDAE